MLIKGAPGCKDKNGTAEDGGITYTTFAIDLYMIRFRIWFVRKMEYVGCVNSNSER